MTKREKFEITLITKEPFRIGGKEDPLRGQENPVAIVGEKIVVPGPSLKGSLRSEIEKLLIKNYYDKDTKSWKPGKEGLKPCIPSPEKQLSKDERLLITAGKYKDIGCHYPCDPKPNKCKNEVHKICPACYLLGANGLNGFARIPFLYADISTASELYSARRDRVTGTVTQGTNRPYSLVPPGIAFKGTMVITIKDDVLDCTIGNKRNLGEITGGDTWLEQDNWPMEKIINDLIIQRIRGIELLGGYKSKGCGNVEITVSPEVWRS